MLPDLSYRFFIKKFMANNKSLKTETFPKKSNNKSGVVADDFAAATSTLERDVGRG